MRKNSQNVCVKFYDHNGSLLMIITKRRKVQDLRNLENIFMSYVQKELWNIIRYLYSFKFLEKNNS